MTRGRTVAAGAAALLALAACDDPGAPDPVMAEETAANAAAPEPLGAEPAREGDPDQVLGAETVEAVFDGYEAGDLVWATLSSPIRPEIRALVDTRKEGLEHFLAAHEGRPMTVRLESVRTYVEQAGGVIEAKKIVGAQTAETSAEVWWQTLGAQEREAARAATERLIARGT